MKPLTLKHLSPYLPYGLKFTDGEHTHEMVGLALNDIHFLSEFGDYGSCALDSLKDKPILRPLSELTREVLDECGYVNEPFDGTIRDYVIKMVQTGQIEIKEWDILISHHFDVFNLLESGHAVSKT